MRSVACLVPLGVVLIAFPTLAANTVGSWPTFAHDYQRTAHADGVGELHKPAVVWSKLIGGSTPSLVADVNGDGRPEIISIDGGRVIVRTPTGTTSWSGALVGARAVLGVWNLDAQGSSEVVVDTPNSLLVLDGATGKLMTSLPNGGPTTAVFVPEANGGILVASDTSVGTVRGFDFRNGLSVTAAAWSIGGGNQLVVGDVDGDGKKEVVRALADGFEVNDPLTGSVEYKLTGLTPAYFYAYQLANVDGVVGDDIVAVDVSYIYSPQSGVHVLGVRNGTLQETWASTDASASVGLTDFYTVAGAAADLDKDGASEVVYSRWNGSKQQWSTYIADGATGTLLGTIPGQLIQAVADVDGDGKLEIVTRATPQQDRLPVHTNLAAYDFDSAKQGPVAKSWSVNDAHVMMASAIPGPWSSIDVPARDDFDPSAVGTELLIGQATNGSAIDTLMAVLKGTGVVGSSWNVPTGTTPSLVAWADHLTSTTSVADVVTFTNDGMTHVQSNALVNATSFATGSYSNRLTAVALGNRMATMIDTSANVLLSIDGTHLDVNGQPYVTWKLPNILASASTDPVTYLGGTSPTIVAVEQDANNEVLVATDVSGVEVWRTALAPLSSPGIMATYATDLTGDGYPDFVVVLTNANAFQSVAIFDGLTGTLVRSTPLNAIVPNADSVRTGALVDLNSDGIPELPIEISSVGVVALNLATNPMTALWSNPSGCNGTVGVANLSQPNDLFRSAGNNGCGPIVRITPNGQTTASFDTGLNWAPGLDRNAAATIRRPNSAMFDLVAAGTDLVALSRVQRIAGDTFTLTWQVYASEGSVSASAPAHGYTLHDPIGFDTDGDGKDEVVFGSDDGYLYALNGSDGSLAFAIDLGAPVVRLVAANVDQDSALELVASLGNGRLVALDEPGHYIATRDTNDGGTSGGDAGPAPDGGGGHHGGGGHGCGCSLVGEPTSWLSALSSLTVLGLLRLRRRHRR